MSKLWEKVKDRGDWHAAVHGVTESDTTEQLSLTLTHTLLYLQLNAYYTANTE